MGGQRPDERLSDIGIEPLAEVIVPPAGPALSCPTRVAVTSILLTGQRACCGLKVVVVRPDWLCRLTTAPDVFVDFLVEDEKRECHLTASAVSCQYARTDVEDAPNACIEKRSHVTAKGVAIEPDLKFHDAS